MPRLMVVEDQEMMRRSMSALLEDEGYEVASFAGPREALGEMGRFHPDVVVSDVKMPGMDGMALLAEIRQSFPLIEVVLVTAHGGVKDAVNAIKQGASDYLLKPFEPDELLVVVGKALERKRLLQEDDLRKRERGEGGVTFVGADGGLRDVSAGIREVAPTDATVLITGESGVGKEVAARVIHSLSGRASAPFVMVNCAALSAGLLESELFGHKKGAFTGADEDRVGRFELADGGTVLLDEITEIEPRLQAKLLRVLQEKEFEPVGSSKTRRVDVRIVATSNRDVEAAVENGILREDLYFRLNVFPLRLPPLREHREDIPALVEFFLREKAPSLGRAGLTLSEGASRALANYDWPGNVRELLNVLERSAVLAKGGVIEDVFLGPNLNGRKNGSNGELVLAVHSGMGLAEVERELIVRTLGRFNGSRKQTAEALGIAERTLRDKLKRMRDKGEEIPTSGGNCR